MKPRRIKVFRNKRRAFNWNGRARGVRNGYYVARFTTRKANGGRDVRNVALRRAKGRFRRLGRVERVRPCALLSLFRVGAATWGKGRPLVVSFRLREPSNVTVTITRKGKVVRRFRGSYRAGRTYRLRYNRRRARIGDYRVGIRVRHPGKTSTSSLAARRLR